jgi:alpha-L-fucosidase
MEMRILERWGAVVLTLCLLHCCSLSAAQLNGTLPNCSFPAVYAFGDSLTDVGNAIAAFPEKFAHSELNPYGVEFPQHPADRYSDGKLFIDFLAFGVRRRPIYAVLRATGADYTYGTNFAASGSSARNNTYWSPNGGFYTPFSLDVQVEWKKRYQERLWFYENMNYGIVTQSLPFLNNTGKSLYVVYAGYQDYFMSLYDNTLTPREALLIVPDVVKAIERLIEKLVTVQTFVPPTNVQVTFPTAENILVVNLPPLGCIPAMLTQFQSPNATYDTYGCLSELNEITAAHNQYLQESVIALRAKYPTVKIYYGDINGVYTDILKNPLNYNVTQPLKACCGVGGSYNFNKDVWCSYTGMVGNELVNLTSAPCANRATHLSWDGIHTSNTFNKAAATAFLTGQHITPSGGFGCSPDFTFWESRT